MKPREMARQSISPTEVAVVLHISPDLAWFKGHFAVQPLLPGVAQLDWVMGYASALLAPGFRFHSIQNVKFQAPLLPGNTVSLTLRWQAAQQTVTFVYERLDGDARHAASSGKIRLCR